MLGDNANMDAQNQSDAVADFSDYEAWGINVAECSQQEKATLARQTAMLQAYSECGSIRKAAPAAGLNRITVTRWMQGDMLGFRARMDAAVQAFRESLQDLAVARVLDPQGNRGSDVLLMGLLNAHWPEKYRPNAIVADDTAKEMLKELRQLSRRQGTGETGARTAPPEPGNIRELRPKGA